ncbi:MAG: hypothetical protein H7A39_04645 [Chlamydiales bacterium]|nr:hypothetical protein [Chlamydiales bacterium]
MKITSYASQAFLQAPHLSSTQKITSLVRRHPWVIGFTVGAMALTVGAGLGIYLFKIREKKTDTKLPTVEKDGSETRTNNGSSQVPGQTTSDQASQMIPFLKSTVDAFRAGQHIPPEMAQRAFTHFWNLEQQHREGTGRLPEEEFQAIKSVMIEIGKSYQGEGLTPYDTQLLEKLTTAPDNKFYTDLDTGIQYYQPLNNRLLSGLLKPSIYGFEGVQILKAQTHVHPVTHLKQVCDVYGLKRGDTVAKYLKDQLGDSKEERGWFGLPAWKSQEPTKQLAMQSQFIEQVNCVLDHKIQKLGYAECITVSSIKELVEEYGYTPDVAAKYCILFLYYKPVLPYPSSKVNNASNPIKDKITEIN